MDSKRHGLKNFFWPFFLRAQAQLRPPRLLHVQQEGAGVAAAHCDEVQLAGRHAGAEHHSVRLRRRRGGGMRLYRDPQRVGIRQCLSRSIPIRISYLRMHRYGIHYHYHLINLYHSISSPSSQHTVPVTTIINIASSLPLSTVVVARPLPTAFRTKTADFHHQLLNMSASMSTATTAGIHINSRLSAAPELPR